VNDQKLIDAKAGMIAADEAIDQLYSNLATLTRICQSWRPWMLSVMATSKP